MANTIDKGITITFRGDTTSFDESVRKVNKDLKDTKSELSILNKELKLDPTNFDKLSQKMDLLKKKEALLTEEISSYRQAMEKLEPTSEAFKQAEMKVRNLELQLKQTTKEIEQMGGNKVALAFNVIGQKLQDTGKKVTELGKKFSGLSAVASGVLAGFGKLTVETAKTADEINTLAKQTGLSTDTLQVFGQMADLIDVDLNSLAKSAQYVAKNMDTKKAQEAYKQLGVSVKNTNGTYKSHEEILFETIKALQNVESENKRTSLGTALLGKNYNQLGSIINDSTVDVKGLTQAVKENGNILSKDELTALNNVNDNIDKMKMILGGMGSKIASEFSEPAQKLTEKIVQLAQKVGEFVDKLSTKDKERILTVIAVIAGISPVLIAVGTALTMLGKLLSGVGTIITTLTPAVKLLNSVFASNPIGVVVVAVTALIGALVLAYNKSETFRNAVNNLWSVIKGKLQVVIDALKNTLRTLKENFEKVKQAVSDLIEKFKNSTFAQGFTDAMDKVRNAVNSIKQPLADAKKWLGDVTGKVSGFLNSGYNKVSSWAKGIFGSGGFGNVAYMSGGYGTLELSTTINVNNNGSSLSAYDAQIFGRQIVEYVNDKLGRRI